MTDSESSAIEYITDYSASSIEALAVAEENGAIFRAVYDDATEELVAVAQITNPNMGGTGSASIGATYSAATSSEGALLKTQSLKVSAVSGVNWSGTVEIGSMVLEFEDGLLVAVSTNEGGNDGYSERHGGGVSL